MHYQKKIITFILMTICFLAANFNDNDYYKANNSEVVYPQTNNSFPFQGYFTDSLGRPYFGVVTMGFEFYGDSEEKNLIYSEDTMRLVTVYNGLYATKLSLPPDAFAKLASYDDIWVKVYVLKSGTLNGNRADGWKELKGSEALKPLVQLTAAPYALRVRGLSYQSNGVLKVGKTYQSTTNILAASDGRDNLIVSGNVGIATLNVTTAKLVVNGSTLDVKEGNISVNGDISAELGGVWGAVWN